MLLNWVAIHEARMRLNRCRDTAGGDALADPLDRAEWRRRGWVIRILCRLSRY
ncbi:MAG: hypothetical protein ACOH2J_20750 [Allorhizobium sp.]